MEAIQPFSGSWQDWEAEQRQIAAARQRPLIFPDDLPKGAKVRFIQDYKTGTLVALWRGRIIQG